MSDELREFVTADRRAATNPATLRAMFDEAKKADRTLQRKFIHRLGVELTWGVDLAFAADWLLSLLSLEPEGRGQKRTDPAAHASSFMVTMLRQTNLLQAEQDRMWKTRFDRAALQASAERALLEPLRALVAGDGSNGMKALRVLVAVAADAQRWEEVDRLTADASRGDAVVAVVTGLLSASGAYVERSVTRKSAPTGLVEGSLARVLDLRPRLRKAELGDIDERVERQSKNAGITTSATPSVKVLVDRLLEAPVKKRSAAWSDVLGAIRKDPSAVAALPSITSVPANGPRGQIAQLHFFAIRARGDVAAARAHLAELERLKMSPTSALSDLGNGKASRVPFLELVLPLLDDPDPHTRWWTAYLVLNAAREDKAELADWAPLVLRSITDGVRPPGSRETITSRSRPALVAALEVTKRRADFVAAARAVDRELPPERRKVFRTQLRALFPEALASLGKPSSNARPAQTAEALLAAVYADLADDDARLVYADALLEAGDVRGEFIVLQCERAKTGATPQARELALARMNARAWVGPAGAWLAPTMRYERGFLVAAAHGGKGSSVDAKATADPVWTTLEELDMTKGNGEVAFLSSPILRSLHTLTGMLASDFVRIKGRSLRQVGLWRVDIEPSRVVSALAKHEELASLDLGQAPEPELMLLAAARLPKLRTISFKKRRFERNGAEWKESRKR